MTQIDHSVVVLFDGVCNLCNGAVQFIIKRDPEGRLKFSSLQSTYAQNRLATLQFTQPELSSILVVRDNKVLMKGDAILEIARHLAWPWRSLKVFKIIPRPIRDYIYTFIAAHRYRWFGKQDQCMIPSPELKARFLG